MFIEALEVIWTCFAVGAIAIFFINRKGTVRENRQRWIKYTFYFLIVHMVILSIAMSILWILAVVIIFVGAYEIVINGRGHRKILTIAMASYLFICFAFFVFAYNSDYDSQFIVYTVVLLFDGFCQICGQLFGKNKLAQSVSPNKTIEGTIGGLIVTLIVMFLCFHDQADLSELLATTTVVCIASLGGDLLASYYKRRVGIKDFSNLIPGHGGILDRFDSFIAAGATVQLLMTYV